MAESRCIVTFVHGKLYERQFSITGPRMKSYATKLNADFIVIKDDVCPRFVLENKFRASEYFKKYDRSLFLDTDVFIRDDSPDIFNYVPKNSIGILDELTSNLGVDMSKWIVIDEICESERISKFAVKRSFNSGVMVFCRELAHLFDPPENQLPDHWCAEQNLLTARIEDQKIKVFDLSLKWNCLWNSRNFVKEYMKSHFVHFNGCKGNCVDHLMELDIHGRLSLDERQIRVFRSKIKL